MPCCPLSHRRLSVAGYYAEAKPGAEYTLRYTNLAREPIGANLYVDGHEADLWHLVSTKFHHEGKQGTLCDRFRDT